MTTLAYLSYQGILNVNWNKLQSSSQWLVDASVKATSTGIPDVMTHQSLMDWGLPLTGGMAMGFATGFMNG